jgi:hypothetical protein
MRDRMRIVGLAAWVLAAGCGQGTPPDAGADMATPPDLQVESADLAACGKVGTTCCRGGTCADGGGTCEQDRQNLTLCLDDMDGGSGGVHQACLIYDDAGWCSVALQLQCLDDRVDGGSGMTFCL